MGSRLQDTVLGKEALPIISNEHNIIHGGRMLTAQVSNAALAAAASLLMEMIIPSGIEVHLKSVTFYVSDDGHFEFIEAPTITDGTTPITIYNRKRKSVNVSSISGLFSDPTGISGGEVLDNIPFTNTNQSNNPPMTFDWEWIPLDNTKYLIRLTNDGASPATAFVKINWYDYLI